jgi:tetratricopeptide (TPR) repeat protein
MWWVFREPRFERHGMVAALGVGNQMLAALPASDLVIVNRADTYAGEGTPTGPLLDLVEAVLAARTGALVAEPRLVALEDAASDPRLTRVPAERLQEFAGAWDVPAPELGLPAQARLEIAPGDGHLVAISPQAGTFALHLQEDGTLHEEDSRDTYVALRDAGGALTGLASADAVVAGALAAAAAGERERAGALLAHTAGLRAERFELDRALVALLLGDPAVADERVRALAAGDPASIEARVNAAGYGLLQSGSLEPARAVFALNTRVFPEAFNTWDSLGEACLRLGQRDEARRHYERSLALNAENANAREQIARLGTASAQ